jgi:hypothetical protein
LAAAGFLFILIFRRTRSPLLIVPLQSMAGKSLFWRGVSEMPRSLVTIGIPLAFARIRRST